MHPVEQTRGDTFFRTVISNPEGVDCIPAGSDPDLCLQPDPILNLDRYEGELGYALWEADLYRRRLALRAAERANVNSAYNALLWPLGAFVGARAVADPSAATLRDAAAVAAGSYGLLNSGVSGRDRLYMAASQQMACEIIWASADLYEKSAISGDANGSVRPGLTQVLEQLGGAIEGYDSERRVLAVTIEAKPAPQRPPLNAIDRRYAEVSGQLKTVGTPVDSVQRWTHVTNTQLEAAREQYQALNALRQTVLDSGTRLRLRRSAVEARLNMTLIEAAPELTRLDQVLEQVANLKTQIEKTVTPSNTANAQAGKKDAPEADILSTTTIKGLTRDSQDKIRDFARTEGRALAKAITQAERWVQQYKQRQTNAKTLAERSHCSTAPAALQPTTDGAVSEGRISPLPR